jgi:hypothetical protein
MKLIKLYKPLTYTLSLPVLILSICCLFGILLAFVNPTMMIPIFILLCVVIYYISSFIFLWRIILSQRTCKKITKDLIKINGMISIVFCVMILLNFSTLLFNPSLIQKGIMEAMAQNTANLPPSFTNDMLIKFVWILMSLFALFALMLLTHIIIGFRLMKQYASSFLEQ